MDDATVVPPKSFPWLVVLIASNLIFFVLTLYFGYQNYQLREIVAGITKDNTLPPPESEIKVFEIKPNTNWKMYESIKYSYQITFPSNWEALADNFERESVNFQNGVYEIGVSVYPTNRNTIQEYLTDADIESASAWEGTPSTKAISTRLTKIGTYNVVRREEEWLASGYPKPIVNTYFLSKGYIYSITLRSSNYTDQSDKPAIEIYDQILSTFKFLDQNSFTCPANNWVDCMPILDGNKKATCSPEALTWYKTNCPNFQGAAY